MSTRARIYNFAFAGAWLKASSCSAILVANLPRGLYPLATSLASSELACLVTTLAAIPCMMTASYKERFIRENLKYTYQPSIVAGWGLTLNAEKDTATRHLSIGYFRPEHLQYSCRSSSIGGTLPSDSGKSLTPIRIESSSPVYGISYGCIKFARSDRGCPYVDEMRVSLLAFC
jgi:hypothetical protein